MFYKLGRRVQCVRINTNLGLLLGLGRVFVDRPFEKVPDDHEVVLGPLVYQGPAGLTLNME